MTTRRGPFRNKDLKHVGVLSIMIGKPFDPYRVVFRETYIKFMRSCIPACYFHDSMFSPQDGKNHVEPSSTQLRTEEG